MKLKEMFAGFKTDSLKIQQPFIIAEIGVNHEGDMDLAKRLIDEAVQGGADAVKFQSYKAETIAQRNSPSYWDLQKEPTTSQFQLFKKYDKFWKSEYEDLKKYCDDAGIEFMSTAFDVESAKFLNDLMDVYKISSSDITNKPFIEFMCQFGKPIVLSTGASDVNEIKDAVGWIDRFNIPLALLHCILNYPTKDENANLGMILTLKEQFPNRIIGYSDHTQPKDMKVPELAVLLGAVIIEKHFTHDKTLPGNDHYHAMDFRDLQAFRKNMDRAIEIVGRYDLVALESEGLSRKHARRSLVAVQDIPAGKTIAREDLIWKRPANGISPKEIDRIVGKTAKETITRDTAIQESMLK